MPDQLTQAAVLRNFAAPEGDKLTAFGASLGTVAEWDFGAVNDLAGFKLI